MKNIIAIIQAHGGLEALIGNAIRVDPPGAGLMRLCIEYIFTIPRRNSARISVAHYFEQEGDLCQDPEMVFEFPVDSWDNSKAWQPVFFQQAIPPVYQEAMVVEDGQVKIRPNLTRDHRNFMATWDRNIGDQGYVEAFIRQKGGGESSPG